jgi:protein-disulfide isomerase
MICFVALFVFAVLAIFSAKYRPLAKEAFDCVFKRITLRPCESGLDERIKATLVSSVFSKSPKAAAALNKHFELFSWALTIIMIVSLAYSAIGIYNWWAYGNCNGPDQTGFCVFNALTGEHGQYSNCGADVTVHPLTPPTSLRGESIGPENAKVTVIEFGCFECKYTKQAENSVKQVLQQYGEQIRFIFKPFPIPTHNNSRITEQAALCAAKQGKFWEYKDALFADQDALQAGDRSVLMQVAAQSGVNESALAACLDSNETASDVEGFYQEGIASGLYGTPTFFINNQSLVGPQSFEAFKAIIDEELRK